MSLKHLVDELLLAKHGRTAKEELTKESYQRFCKEYTFEALKGLRFGQAFCNHFGITDNILYYQRDIERSKKHIKKHYL